MKRDGMRKRTWMLRVAIEIWALFHDTWKQINEAQLFMVASGLAYTTILSVVPVLAISFAVFKAFGGLDQLYKTVEPFILSNLAEGSSEEAIHFIHQFIDNVHAEAFGIGGFFGLIFTSFSMLSSAEKAINQAWQTKSKRTLFQKASSYWLFITLGPLALSVAVGMATSFHFPLWKLFPNGTGIFLIMIGIFYSVYQWVPHACVKWQCALISGVVTASLWNAARMGYNLYARNVVTYHKIYGSLAAVPILLIWIYILWAILLCGAAFTVALQKRLESLPDQNSSKTSN